MKTTIIGFYNKIHQLIKQDLILLDEVRQLASDPSNQATGQYLPIGLKIDDIYLGLDFKKNHLEKFNRIWCNTLAIDNVSKNQADLSRVLLKVIIGGKHVANLTEDVSENGACIISDDGVSFGGMSYKFLDEFFKNDVSRAVFFVYRIKPNFSKSEEARDPLKLIVRLPIIDIDHIEFRDLATIAYDKPPTVRDQELFTLEL